jgi:NAD(P)-dependent dehydrogenase (short-subunit alcohol dehydrogenase family)
VRLDGKVAIVTGGGRGIGRATSKLFASDGCRVVIAQRDPESGERTRQEIEAAGGAAIFVQTDVSHRESIEHMVQETEQRYGRIDILVNNAAKMGTNGHFLALKQEEWDLVMATNLTSVYVCSQVAARVMVKTGGGAIVNITSVNGYLPQPECAAYGAAKGGVEVLTRIMATDLAPYHIRVNVVAPGPIQSRSPDSDPPRPSESTLLGRVGLPQEVANAILFLVSDASSFVTGQSLLVDGGMLGNAYRLYGVPRPKPEQARASAESKSGAVD